jgi:uncharacterized protein YcaQ
MMRSSLTLDRLQARRLLLAAQGLASTRLFGTGPQGTLRAITHLGYVQIDTLAVVARAHHHTLWTRVHDYQEADLETLVQTKQVFEYWGHAASFLPMRDYRFSLPRKQMFRDGRSHWFRKDQRIMDHVLERIGAEGPLQARDFVTDRRRGSWFDWKPAKQALEQLFMDGTLMVAGRKGFQKVYDLAERVLPAGVDTTMPSTEEYAAYLVDTALRAYGIVSARDIAYQRRGMQKPVQQVLQQRRVAGSIVALTVGSDSDLYFTTPETLDKKPRLSKQVRLLSPFDNVVIQRQRLRHFFAYDYQIECYLPEGKRRFGYFCLPILYGNTFVGRLDPKADRQARVFHVKALHLEDPVSHAEPFLHALAQALLAFASFHGCREVQLATNIQATYRPLSMALAAATPV